MKSHTEKSCYTLLTLLFLSLTAYPQNKERRIFDDSTVQILESGSNIIADGFGPSAVNGTLFFTTYDENANAKKKNRGKKEFYNLYKVEIDKQGNIIGKRQPFGEISSRYNTGPVAWCQKTGELFITQNYADPSVKRKPFQDEIIRLKIIIAKEKAGKWEYAGDFPYFNSSYSVGHPAISASGDTLIFSSDMPGGLGLTDLYYSIRRNGKWEAPVNLGPKINTSGKEEFAFITDSHFDGKRYLIFASNGRNGKGGLDLYYTTFPSDGSEIGHFESPLNTPYDDFALTIPSDAEYGFLTSARGGKDVDDIYKFTFKRVMPLAEKPKVEKPKEAPVIVKETPPTVPEIKFVPRQQIVLHNIYYDFDKWDISPESAQELDQLVKYMKENPEYIVELGSHTDNRGSNQYNMKLSQLRAQAAVDYIISKGISKSQIVGKGYGESQLINKCYPIPCTPEQHRENRRTEIYITESIKGEPVKQVKGDF